MKKKGALMEFSEERMIELMKVYDKYIHESKFICLSDIYKMIVNLPSSRFWVSDGRATIVVRAITKGKPILNTMCETKREMYREIFNRVISLKEKYPDKSITQLCSIVVAQPAPKFYLTAGTAKMMICKFRKTWIAKKLQRLQH